ncbi:MAG: DNA repair protein RadC [Pseudomonadota bacterium]|nr:DNA repair protein RadC [Pseudomonadota bacterium]
MSIKNWPENERPREKLLHKGAQSLSDSELLAILLRTGTIGLSAVDLARSLLKEFGGLRALLTADKKSFCQGKGLGMATYVQCQAVLEIARRHYAEHLVERECFTSPEHVRDYLQASLRDRQAEVFCVLFLDNRHRLICFEECFNGTIDGASVHPREIVRKAIHHNAAAVILAHNHPSGIAEPSQADISLTSRLKDALGLVDVRVLDHFIVGDGLPISFSERGLM